MGKSRRWTMVNRAKIARTIYPTTRMSTQATVLLALLVLEVTGHAQMFEPPSRSTGGNMLGTPNCAGGSCLWFNNGAYIGCLNCTGDNNVPSEKICPDPAAVTIPLQDKTYGTVFGNLPLECLEHPIDCAGMFVKGYWKNLQNRVPWRHPGAAPVYNPCGLNGGGYVSGPSGTGGEAFFGHPQGFKGTDVTPLLHKTMWIAGSTVEVAWGITANHGGGYQYRLCRVGQAGVNNTAEATEECFQQTPLEFVGDVQWIQFGAHGSDPSNRTAIPAVRVTDGVLPEGSTWTRNPIPACDDLPRMGGHNHKCAGPMFKPPTPGVYGFGPGACASGAEHASCSVEEMASRALPYGIVDKVKIPDSLPDGDYILSFRWDIEQLPQVFSSCADVEITRSNSTKPTKPFSSWVGCEACCEATRGICAHCSKCLDVKTGDCAKCWKPLPGFTFGAIPEYQCLGGEGPDGGPGTWQPGMPFKGIEWSPGCPKCWNTTDSCHSRYRESL